MPDTTPLEVKDDLEEKAEETQAELRDAKADVRDARKEGDDERATKLEARVDSLSTDLSEIKSALKSLVERPFAPAPQAKESPTPEEKSPEPTKPKDRVHRFGSTSWFGSRAFED